MIFNSLQYFLFLPIVFLAFYLVADRYRWLVLLIASYVFYGSFKAPQLLIALALVTAVSFSCGAWLGRAEREGRRKLIFWLGTAACVLILAAMKCTPLLLASTGIPLPNETLLIFIGVSYFSFQAISYLADVYMEIQEPERHVGYHALSLAFFPKLLQGPIERAGDLLPQLKSPYEFDYNGMRSGMLLFAFGLFKKVVVADRLALYVNPVYQDVHAYTGLPLMVATYAYALQIYFDFSGYTDMARGTGRMFGINLTENFNSPYFATSIAEFWRRWHISFSRWLMDYIFKPLQISWRDRGQAGIALALIVTFLVCGIWHGLTWGFIIWGLLHGIYMAGSSYYRPYQKKLYQWLGIDKVSFLKAWQVFVTFNLVSFAWIFFRGRNLGDAWYILKNIFNISGSYVLALKLGFREFVATNIFIGNGRYEFLIIVSTLLIAFLVQHNRTFSLSRKPTWLKFFIYILIISSIEFLGVTSGDFIYFKF
jgi:D-alanyl-lipoteichoic acid acyltransferase DltB (MBOAT superfamily)